MSAILRDAHVESWEDHIEAWHHLGRQVDDASWSRAAIAASVKLKGQYGEDNLGKFAAEVGFSFSAVYQFARTFETFPELCTRVQTLTFSHHRLAAVLTADAEQARTAVALAGRDGWSTGALRAYLKPPAAASALPATSGTTGPSACSASPGACGPITTDDKIFHISSLIENFYAVKDYEIDPLVRVGTKKSLKELSEKVTEVIGWLQALNQSIHKRSK